MKHFKAPWSGFLIGMTVSFALLCLGATFFFPRAFWFLNWVPLTVLAGAALFAIRGYTVLPGAILVHRLGWATRLPLDGLEEVEVHPNAMRGAIRLFGNGGVFSFTGYYRNRTLGSFRVFVTDPRRTVVLRYPKRTLVLSPADPEEFRREVVALKD